MTFLEALACYSKRLGRDQSNAIYCGWVELMTEEQLSVDVGCDASLAQDSVEKYNVIPALQYLPR